MTTPTIRAALYTFQQAANSGVAVYVSSAIVQELREALDAGSKENGLPPGYIDPEHVGENRELLETFYRAANAEGGTADEIHLRGIRAVLARRSTPTTPKICINFNADIRIEEQLKDQGLRLDMDPYNRQHLQRDIDEVNRLKGRRILTDMEAGNAFRRIFRIIKLHAKPL